MKRLAHLVSLLALVGCGSYEEPPPAPEPFIAEPGPPRAPAAPDIPWWTGEGGGPAAAPATPAPDRLLPCGEGFEEVARPDGDAVCVPWGEAGRPTCTDPEVALLGQPCAPLGRACPAEAFPPDADLPGPSVFVAVGAGAGDGTREAPFGTIAEAVAAAPGATVVLGEGTHDLDALPPNVTMEGVCPGLARLRGGPFVVSAGSVSLRHLTVLTRLEVAGGALALEGVIVHRAREVGVDVAAGASLVGRDLLVRSSLPGADDRGIGVRVRGAADLDRVNVETSTAIALMALDGGELRVAHGLVADTWNAGVVTGVVHAETGGRVVLEDSLLLDNRGIAVAAFGEGASVDLEGVVVEGVTPTSNGYNGIGVVASVGGSVAARRLRVSGTTRSALWVTDGGALEVRSARVEDAGTQSVLVDGEGSTATLADSALVTAAEVGAGVFEGGRLTLAAVAIREAADPIIVHSGSHLAAEDLRVEDARPTGERFGRGLEVYQSTATLARATVRRVRNRGVYVVESELDAEDLTVADVEDEETGFGLHARAATLALRRATIERARRVGLVVNESSVARIEDVLVSGTRPAASDGTWGIGLELIDADLTADRVVIDGSHARGWNAGPSTASVHDLRIQDTQPEEAEGAQGQGLNLWGGAVLEAERIALEGNHYYGALIQGEGTRADLADVSVSDTRPQRSDGTSGHGLTAMRAAEVTLVRATLRRNHSTGLWSAWGALLTAQDVRVEETLENECPPDVPTCGSGNAIVATAGGVLSATRFAAGRSDLCGLMVANFGIMSVYSGEVFENAVGACVQVEDYDIGRLRQEVRYRDNGRAIEATTLPVPDSISPPTFD